MYKTTIGLEIHCELKTASKIFCDCENSFGGEPNTKCCPVCSGFPGVLPVLNKKAVEYTVKAGLALNCRISEFSKWDRKNYFYPDLPKAWQTSQYDLPLCNEGKVQYTVGGQKKCVRINRIHLEEDAGKLMHAGTVSFVDYNRCGVPLMEIVTEPDLECADDVVAFLDELKSILKYTGVSDVKMQEGSLRCDVNLSVSDSNKLGTRTETKNLNSFSAAKRCILFETARQIELLESGGMVTQETRRWDDGAGEGYSMRSKENAHDYRYFPEPDLLPVVISAKQLAEIKMSIPELKNERMAKYIAVLGLPEYDAQILTSDKDIADLFDGAINLGANAKKTSNFIMGEVLRLAKAGSEDEVNINICANQLFDIVKMVEEGSISLVAARTVLEKLWNTDCTATKIVEQLGLKQNNDSGEIEAVVRDIILANPKVVADFKSGNEKTMAFFVGQVMKATKGKSNPKVVNEILVKLLGEL